MYKNTKTTYVVRNIPVTLWKKVKAKFAMGEQKSIGDLIISLLQKWVNDDK